MLNNANTLRHGCLRINIPLNENVCKSENYFDVKMMILYNSLSDAYKKCEKKSILKSQ